MYYSQNLGLEWTQHFATLTGRIGRLKFPGHVFRDRTNTRHPFFSKVPNLSTYFIKLQVYIITYVDGKGLHERTCLVEIELKQGERIREKQDSGFLDINAWNS